MNLTELKKLLTLCRKQGVTEIDFEGIKVKFGDLPAPRKLAEGEAEEETDDELTSEQLMFYSAGGTQ
jgi:hypothetical protein